MNSETGSLSPESLALQHLKEIDRVCSEFDAAWRNRQSPRIEEFLQRASTATPDSLLTELLKVELDYRRGRGETPTAAEYEQRLPDFASQVADFFRCQAETLTCEQSTVAPAGSLRQPSQIPATSLRRFGDYELLHEIGGGGMGVVYKARQRKLNRLVALKMIKSGELANEQEVKRFQGEAQLAAKLDHPNIVPVFEVGEQSGQHFFSMAFVEGQSLAERLKNGPLPPREAAELVKTLAEAVQYAHDKGIIHRDLKPANVMLQRVESRELRVESRNEQPRSPQFPLNSQRSTLNPRITDFGLAKNIAIADSGLTQTGQIFGTPSYMPPEQAAGKVEEIGPLADVYSLGALLYATLTGRPPFQAATSRETLNQVIDQDPVSPRQLNAVVDRDLETVCLKCLEKDAAKRYESAAALAEDLNRHLTGCPILARPVGRIERGWRWAKRHPARAGLIATGCVALLAVVGLSVGYAYQQELESANRDLETANVSLGQTLEREEALSGQLRTAVGETEAAKQAAEKARDAEEKAKETLAVFEYGRTMEVAHQEWRENNIARARALLKSTDPKLRGWEWYYVHRLCHADLVTLEGHTGGVTSASFSPDGSQIVGASGNGITKVWDAKTGTEVLTLNKRHTGPVKSATFSPDGSRIVTGSWDRTAIVWDAKTGDSVRTLKHSGPVDSASFSQDGSRIVTVSFNNTAKVGDARAMTGTAIVWDARTGKKVRTLEGHTGPVYSASFSPDGSRIVTGSWDKTAIVWDAKTGKKVHRLKQHKSYVNSASFSPDGSRIVTASSDNTAIVWDAKNGDVILMLKGHIGPLNSASFNPEGLRIVTTGSIDNTAKVWDAKTGAEVLTLKGHTAAFNSASFSPDGSRIVTASWDNTARIWDATAPADALTIIKGHTLMVTSASFSPDLSRVVSKSIDINDNTATVRDAKTGAEILTLRGHRNSISSASFSSDGSRIVTGSADRTAKVWDAKTGAEVLTLRGHTAPVNSASFSPDGSRIITTGSLDNTAKVWDVKTGAELLTLKGLTELEAASTSRRISLRLALGGIASASFSPDGSQIILVSGNGEARVFDARPMNREFVAKSPFMRNRIVNWQDQARSRFAIYHSAAKSVVHVSVLEARANGRSNPSRGQGTGSGIIWDAAGHIVTNSHFLGTAKRFKVILKNRTVAEAALIGIVPHCDIAVLKVNAATLTLTPIAIGRSSDLQIGRSAYAIGHPFGRERIVFSAGVIKALGRTVESPAGRRIQDVIQTNVAINRGNSGGPLLDSAGRLIGVNTAIIEPGGSPAGFGFAVPVDEVRRLMQQIIRRGKIRPPGLGLTVLSNRDRNARGQAGSRGSGVLVKEVVPGGPADAAGIRPTRITNGKVLRGDSIIAIDDKPMKNSSDIEAVLDRHKAGDTLTVTLIRDGKRRNVQVTLKAP